MTWMMKKNAVTAGREFKAMTKIAGNENKHPAFYREPENWC